MEPTMNRYINSKIKRPKIETVIMVITFVIFVLYAISLVLPFIWAYLSSLKTDDEYFEKVFAWPRDWLFSNYITAFSEFKVGGTSFVEMFANSVWLTLGGTFFNIFVSAMTAYVMAKYNFKGRDLIYKIIIFKMVIPIVGNLPAKFNLIVNLGINNPIGIMLTYMGGFDFNFIILHGFFRSVSWNYAEAGFMDGASHFTVFWRIILPQALPAMIAVGILAAIGVWNDYMTPFLYLRNNPTLALGIYQFQEIQQYRSNVPVYYCAILMTVLPVIVVFALFQKTIMENTVAGGLKG